MSSAVPEPRGCVPTEARRLNEERFTWRAATVDVENNVARAAKSSSLIHVGKIQYIWGGSSEHLNTASSDRRGTTHRIAIMIEADHTCVRGT